MDEGHKLSRPVWVDYTIRSDGLTSQRGAIDLTLLNAGYCFHILSLPTLHCDDATQLPQLCHLSGNTAMSINTQRDGSTGERTYVAYTGSASSLHILSCVGNTYSYLTIVLHFSLTGNESKQRLVETDNNLLSCVVQRSQEVYDGGLLSSPDVVPVSGL
jgi:hypothetical protein